MKYKIDTDLKALTVISENNTQEFDLYSPEAFELLSDVWVKVGWDQKHCYTFSWMGRPIIQLPDDMLRMQELIWSLKPDVIIETGVAHGGSLIYYASICSVLGKGKIVGVDIEIRPHNRRAIEEHKLFPYITLIEGSSTATDIVEQVREHVKEDDTVLVILDSDHSYKHVIDELNAYADFVSVGSYIVSTDGVMKDLTDVPRGQPHWDKDNPTQAAIDFAASDNRFEISAPDWVFNESPLRVGPTHWPSAWLKRIA